MAPSIRKEDGGAAAIAMRVTRTVLIVLIVLVGIAAAGRNVPPPPDAAHPTVGIRAPPTVVVATPPATRPRPSPIGTTPPPLVPTRSAHVVAQAVVSATLRNDFAALSDVGDPTVLRTVRDDLEHRSGPIETFEVMHVHEVTPCSVVVHLQWHAPRATIRTEHRLQCSDNGWVLHPPLGVPSVTPSTGP